VSDAHRGRIGIFFAIHDLASNSVNNMSYRPKRFLSITRKLLAAALFVQPPFIAQAVSVEGDRSLTLFGNGSSDDDFSTTTFGASGDLGYSVTDSQDIGVRQDVNLTEFENDTRWNGTRVCSMTLNSSALKDQAIYRRESRL
jgi:hypothetical protein